MITKIILVMVGGGLGSLSRYGLTLLAANYIGVSFPWGTLLANLIGCFLIGVGFALADINLLSPSGRLFFMTGFLGGLTTFSTFALETVTATRAGIKAIALANFLINNLGGMILVGVGMWLTQFVLKGE